MQTPQKNILFVQNSIPHYRVSFFSELKTQLSNENIHLTLLYNPTQNQPKKNQDYRSGLIPKEGLLPWAKPCPIRWAGQVGWQPILPNETSADLVILHQENKYLSSLYTLLKRTLQNRKTAFFGHGKNFQGNPNSPQEILKRLLAKLPSWWFPYTEISTQYLLNIGYPKNQITTVQNSTDTQLLKKLKNELSPEILQRLKSQLKISSDQVALYCGGLTEKKNIPLLVQTALQLKEKIPDFHLLILGGGPLEPLIPNTPWIHLLGPKSDEEKVPYWAISKILLMPGLMGLAAVDSLALGVPAVITQNRIHSPEIHYLHPNKNCIQTPNHLDNYTQAAYHLLTNPEDLQRLSNQCLLDSKNYSSQIMANNMSQGIIQALKDP